MERIFFMEKHPIRCKCDSCQEEQDLEKNLWSLRSRLEHAENIGANNDASRIKKQIDDLCRGKNTQEPVKI